jgi:hypothetical protein
MHYVIFGYVDITSDNTGEKKQQLGFMHLTIGFEYSLEIYHFYTRLFITFMYISRNYNKQLKSQMSTEFSQNILEF